jgi:hypothetical protein
MAAAVALADVAGTIDACGAHHAFDACELDSDGIGSALRLLDVEEGIREGSR